MQDVLPIHSLRIRLPHTLGKDPRPTDGEPVRIHAHVPHYRDVFLVLVVMLVGDITRVVVLDLPRRVSEAVPDRLAFPVLVQAHSIW